MKKFILLLIMTFLFTGCNCNYTLKIDDKVSEEIEVVVPNSISDTKKNQVDNILKDLNPIIDDCTEQISSQPIDNKLKIKDRVFYTVTE